MNRKRLNLLLVEYNPSEAALLQEQLNVLAELDFTFGIARTIPDAVKELKEGDFQAVILDLNLPSPAGVGSYEQLREHALTMPIVVLSGPDNKSLSTQALEAGADGSLVKGELNGGYIARELLMAIAKRDRIAVLTSKTQAEEKPPPLDKGSSLEAAAPVVFVVERDPHIKYLLEGFLREGGYEVLFADDGYGALDAVRQKLPGINLLIAEMYAPHLDGLRLTRILRGEEGTKDLPIIIMSPVDASERALAAGANAFLKKPIEKKRVLATVTAVVGLVQRLGEDNVK